MKTKSKKGEAGAEVMEVGAGEVVGFERPYPDLDTTKSAISALDSSAQARVHHHASTIRDIALLNEEGRLALYLVFHEGSV